MPLAHHLLLCVCEVVAIKQSSGVLIENLGGSACIVFVRSPDGEQEFEMAAASIVSHRGLCWIAPAAEDGSASQRPGVCYLPCLSSHSCTVQLSLRHRGNGHRCLARPQSVSPAAESQ